MTKAQLVGRTERRLQDECGVADFIDKRAFAKWDDIPKSRNPGSAKRWIPAYLE
jgi:hypothetical protein